MDSPKKHVTLMGLASFFNDAGTELLTPILPALVFALGGNEFWVGFVSAIKEALPPLTNFIGGFVAEKLGSKKTTLFSYILSGIGKLLVAFSSSLYWLVYAVSIDRIGKGIRGPARDSWVAALMPKKKGEGFAIRQLLDSAGALLGALLAAYLLSQSVPLMYIALLAGLFGLAGALPISIIPAFQRRMKKVKGDIPALLLALVFFIYFTAFGVVIALSLAEDAFQGALLFVLYNIIYVISVYPAGLLADKFGKSPMLSLALLFFVIASFLFMWGHLFLAFSLFALGYASFKSNLKALVGDVIGSSAKGFGILEGSMGLGALSGNLILGWALQLYGSAAFYIPVATAVISLLLLVFLRKS